MYMSRTQITQNSHTQVRKNQIDVTHMSHKDIMNGAYREELYRKTKTVIRNQLSKKEQKIANIRKMIESITKLTLIAELKSILRDKYKVQT